MCLFLLTIPLLDNEGCAVIGNFQMDQRHIMLKVHLRAPDETIYSHTKKVCLKPNASIRSHCMELGYFMIISPLFIMFLCT